MASAFHAGPMLPTTAALKEILLRKSVRTGEYTRWIEAHYGKRA